MRNRVNHKARPRKGHPYAFKDYDDDGNIHQSMVGFLQDVWRGAPERSFFFLATTDPDGNGWREHAIPAVDNIVALNKFLRVHRRWDFNLYFCPNPFSTKRRKRKYALSSRLGWCDMDESDPNAYQPEANHVWETSPGRYQALWLWDKRHTVVEAEDFSRALAKRHGGDTGWSITKMLRIPGSVNHKPKYDEPVVRLVSRNWRKVEERPEPFADGGRSHRNLVLDFDHTAFTWDEVLKKYRRVLDPKARSLIRDRRVYEADRSEQIFHMVVGLYEVSASIDEIASVIWGSPYFQDKYHGNVVALHAELARILSKIGSDS